MAVLGPDGKPTKWSVTVAFDRKSGQLMINREDATTPMQACWLLQQAALVLLTSQVPQAQQMPVGDVPP